MKNYIYGDCQLIGRTVIHHIHLARHKTITRATNQSNKNKHEKKNLNKWIGVEKGANQKRMGRGKGGDFGVVKMDLEGNRTAPHQLLSFGAYIHASPLRPSRAETKRSVRRPAVEALSIYRRRRGGACRNR